MIAIIGSSGFIGKNLSNYYRKLNLAYFAIEEDTNSNDYINIKFETVFFCAGNSKTYLSDKDPVFCLQRNVIDLIFYLKTLKFEKFVYISSITVYNSSLLEKCEEAVIDISNLSIYATNKFIGEKYVKHFSDNFIIIRPTGFFGPFLSKNLLFDLKNNKPIIYFRKDSFVDYIPIQLFCEIIVTLSKTQINQIFNVGSGVSLSVEEILSITHYSGEIIEERFQDDRNISLNKLNRIFPLTITKMDLFQLINDFLKN